MAVFKLRIFTENNKTHTRLAVASSDTIVFKNDTDRKLWITVDKEDALLEDCKRIDLIQMAAGDERSFSMNAHYPLESMFKYTATVAGFESEDPIIIIEKR